MTPASDRPHRGNLILDTLPQVEYNLLHPHLQLVQLQAGEVLIRIREPIAQVYFPVTAVVSGLQTTLEGDSIEVGLTGCEGMVEPSLLFNQTIALSEAKVQIAGAALQLSAEVFVDALAQAPALRQWVGHFVYLKIMQASQSALCNRFHPVEQRLCRWLLAAQDCTGTAELELIRDRLVEMMGSTRSAVGLVIGTLQSAGLIRVALDRITILNREALEEASCECYQVIKQQIDRYLQS